jgi:hypothetical protein
MNDTNRPKNFLAHALPTLVIAAVPLAAFLAFVILPLMGKCLLPVYGGTSGIWVGCMVYFQLTLLLGYGWAAWLARKGTLFQMTATVALAVVAVLTFHLPSGAADAAASTLNVVWRLSVASLPAMVLLFSASPLLHTWLNRRGESVPYYVHALAGAASLLALLLYPVVIESSLGLGDQRLYWHGCLVIVAALLAVAGYVVRNFPADAPAPEPAEALEPGTVLLWLWLSALTCAGMLAATYHVTAEIGSNPMAWAGPFGLYVLSFIVAFSGRWQRWMTLVGIVFLTVSLTGFMVVKGFTSATVNGGTAWCLYLLTACGSLVGNALLHSTRPAQRTDRFYLVLAAGGLLGGLVSGIILPHFFSRPVEFELISVALLVTGIIWLAPRREPSTAVVIACALVIPVLGLGIHQIRRESTENVSIRHSRDLNGHIFVETSRRSVVLSSETTKVASQLTMDAASRRRPTLYFTESSGLGRVLERFQAARPAMNVGVVCSNGGTLAAYSRAGDRYDFWDTDPKSIRVTRENFKYVPEAAGRINLSLRDGRRALEDSKADYDLLVIDALTRDGFPPHLLTAEAMNVYLRRLAARNGLLVVHASSRYSRFYPMLEATARSLGLAAIDVKTDIKGDVIEPGKERDWDPTSTEYIVIGMPEQTKVIPSWFLDEEDKGRVRHLVTTGESQLANAQLVWTDDRNAAIETLDLGRFLFQ